VPDWWTGTLVGRPRRKQQHGAAQSSRTAWREALSPRALTRAVSQGSWRAGTRGASASRTCAPGRTTFFASRASSSASARSASSGRPLLPLGSALCLLRTRARRPEVALARVLAGSRSRCCSSWRARRCSQTQTARWEQRQMVPERKRLQRSRPARDRSATTGRRRSARTRRCARSARSPPPLPLPTIPPTLHPTVLLLPAPCPPFPCAVPCRTRPSRAAARRSLPPRSRLAPAAHARARRPVARDESGAAAAGLPRCAARERERSRRGPGAERGEAKDAKRRRRRWERQRGRQGGRGRRGKRAWGAERRG